MNAQAILIKIEEDAKEAAAKLSSDAKAKAEEMKAASSTRIDGMHQTVLAQAAKDSLELEQRMLRMAELEDRKTLLAKKRALIDDTFQAAKALLLATSASEKRAFFLSQIVRSATGLETLAIGDQAMDWFDADFINDANAALKAAGKTGSLVLSEQHVPHCEGIVLSHGGSEIRCTFDTLLDEARAGLEQKVATELFGQP